MGCCGQARDAAVAAVAEYPGPAPRPLPAPGPAPGRRDPAPEHAVRLRFTQSSAMRVRGPATGLTYDFTAAAPVQPVDGRDAEVLMGTGYFRRAY
ncbi:MAG TPA: hypothetical protein VNP72_05905 [Longimicrobium sp.]|nr:hypothetical protein [Longimicrobium sp.]